MKNEKKALYAEETKITQTTIINVFNGIIIGLQRGSGKTNKQINHYIERQSRLQYFIKIILQHKVNH